jgi:glycosyltransferase involved in cell wall biosynthesis
MRTALVHEHSSRTSIPGRILAVLREIFPSAALRVMGRTVRPSPPSLSSLPRSARLDRYDLVLSTSLAAARRAAVRPGTVHLCYVSAWSNLPASERETNTTLFIAASPNVQNALAYAGHRLCPVLPPPIDTAFYCPDAGPRADFYLLPTAGLSPRECAMAVDACRIARRKLVVVGGLAPEAIAALRREPHVWYAGRQSPPALRYSYRTCRAVLYPGVADFEPSVVEAQGCGAPVIAYYLGGVRTTLIDAEGGAAGTGLLFTEPNATSLASTIEELERRPQCFEPGLLLANAARFSHVRFRAEFNRLLDQVCGESWQQPAMGPIGSEQRGERGRRPPHAA